MLVGYSAYGWKTHLCQVRCKTPVSQHFYALLNSIRIREMTPLPKHIINTGHNSVD